MKINKTFAKIFAILLSALLVAGIVFPLVMAETETLPGQKELFVAKVTAPPVQDGILNGHKVNGVAVDEYGTGGPTFCLSAINGDYRAVDLNGNPMDTELPSYIYLYMAKDADALYLGMEIQEEAHAGDLYEFTTFLGFGDKSDADTMNSGTFTTFKMDNGNSANFDPGTWMDTQVTALSAQKVAADGTVTDTTESRKFSVPFEYTLPAWCSETTSAGKPVTFFEAELDFEDAMLGSGLAADTDLPEYAYFAFELGVFNGTEKIGKIVFDADLTGKADAPDGADKTVPHLLNLKTEFNAGSANNANLSVLSVEGGTLSPAFAAAETNYTLTLPNGTTSANVTATPVADTTRVTVKGADTIDGITAGGNKTITITCVAQNGYVKIYTLNVEWAYDSTDYYVDSSSGNDSTGNGSKSSPYATVEKALAAIAEKEWEIDEMATVYVNGTFQATAPDGVLFGAKTVFTKGATKLPITIKGDDIASDIIHPYVGKAACANDYSFDTLTFAIDGVSGAKLFAGSGEVRFDRVKWTTASAVSATNTVFYGDTFTAKVFEGWTATQIAKIKSQNENGNIDTSITLGADAEYWIAGSAGYYLSAIGDTDGWSDTTDIAVKSSEVEASAILDGSRVSKIAIFTEGAHDANTTVTTTKYAKANVYMLSDGSKAHIIGIDRNGEGRVVVDAEVEIAVYGGTGVATSSYIRGGRADTVNGDFTITVESGEWKYIQGGLGGMYINGDLEINFGGTAYINTAFYGYAGGTTEKENPVTGTVVHNVYGGTIVQYRGLHSSSTIDKVTNNISGGTITSYYGSGLENTSTVVKDAVVNNISGGTITTYYGTYEQTGIAKVQNNISGNATIGSFNGAYKGTTPIVENNISGGTLTGTYNGTYNSNAKKTYNNVSGGEIKGAFYTSYLALKNTDLVKNTITGGTFSGTCILGGYGGNITKVENTISGGTFNNSDSTIYLGSGSSTWPSVVGNIENTITGGDFNKKVYGGGQRTHVIGNITNNIYGGEFGAFYGGIYASYHSTTTKNMIGVTKDGTTAAENSPYFKLGVSGKIINNYGKTGEAGPSFSDPCFGGNLAYIANLSPVTIENNFYSGTWNSTVYGGSDVNNETISSITNNVYGGTFNKFFTAGSYNTPVKTITTNIEGGTWNSYFFGGSRRGNITGDVVNNISGGTFNSYFFGGSDQNTSGANSLIAVENDSSVVTPTTYTIGGSIKNTISGGTFKSAASGAGFGTVKGNVENTIKGTAKFELGYYGVQATLADTVVEGNVLNLVTKDAEGNAPYFAKKNLDIDYVFDNANHSKVYTTSGSNIGFAAVGGSGVVYEDNTKNADTDVPDKSYTKVKGYVETIIEAGEFPGHYYVAGGVDVSGANEDGYGIINIVRGDPVFGYVWSGGCISSSYETAPKTYNEISGGTFKSTFTCFNRTASSGSYANATEVVTVIKGGVFESRVEFSEPWTDSHANQHQRTAPITLTIEGGTFNGDVYGLGYRNKSITGPYLSSGGTLTININGGTFAKNIYAAGYPYTASKFVENAVINIAPTKGDVTILGTVAPRFSKELVNLNGGEYKLILGADASIQATSATGDVKIGQEDAWKKQVYVTMPEGNDANVTVSGTHALDKVADSVVAVKGGVQIYGATMILTDRVAVRALFDKASVDAIENFTFSFTMNNEVLASGDKSSLEASGNNYYSVVLAKIGAGDFTETVTFSGSDMVWDCTFSIKGLAEMAETAWAGNDVDVQLAKAIQNFATIVADRNATLPHNLTVDTDKLNGFKASGEIPEGASFKVTGKGLLMSNAVGIRIYGTSNTDVTADGHFTITVNGNDVTDRAVVSKGAGENEYTIDLFVNAKNMSDELTIVISEKATQKVCLTLTDRVDAIAASYPETHENYNLAQQLLIYIQAAVAYASK